MVSLLFLIYYEVLLSVNSQAVAQLHLFLFFAPLPFPPSHLLRPHLFLCHVFSPCFSFPMSLASFSLPSPFLFIFVSIVSFPLASSHPLFSFPLPYSSLPSPLPSSSIASSHLLSSSLFSLFFFRSPFCLLVFTSSLPSSPSISCRALSYTYLSPLSFTFTLPSPATSPTSAAESIVYSPITRPFFFHLRS